MITGRQLLLEEVEEVWTIDRREVIEHVYHFEDGRLVLQPEHYDMQGWPPGEAEEYTPLLVACLASGGWCHGLFDGAKLIAVVILDNKLIGRIGDQLQLVFLHVSKAHRKLGLGKRLFALAQAEAREKGAKRLYISATPSQNTVDFYLRLDCVVTKEVDPELFAREPEDIHLECAL